MISLVGNRWTTEPPGPSVVSSTAAFTTTCQSAGTVIVIR